MKILYAGDSPAGGPANYLLGILRRMKADLIHLPPGKILKSAYLKNCFDGIVLSDFPASYTPQTSQKKIIEQVLKGTGLLMIGGWGSFAGPFGGWHGTEIEKILPVTCQNRDDRLNFPGGASIVRKIKHPMFRGLSFKNPPVICGLNEIRPKKKSKVVLTARRILDGKNFPLLVVGSDPDQRVASLATDLAPHWCGGMVDWGTKHLKLPVKDKIWIEVGDRYVRFVSNLIRWLVR